MSKPSRRLLPLAAAAATLCLALVGCSGGNPGHQGRVTVTMANQPDTNVQDILPLITPTYSNVLTLNTIRLMYEPLYQFTSTSGAFDGALSLAQAPRFTNGGRTVTVQLKHY